MPKTVSEIFLKLMGNIVYVIIFIGFIIFLFSFISIFGINDPDNLSFIEKTIIYAAEPIVISISVGLLYYHFQIRHQANILANQLKRYENTIELADLLYESKKNFGFRGLVKAVNEKERIMSLSEDSYNEDNYPVIRWMNFKIDDVIGHLDVIRDYVSKGGHIYLLVHSYEDDLIIDRRLKEIETGRLLETDKEKIEDSESENKKLYVNGLIQRSARLIAFHDSLSEARGKFFLGFCEGNVGIPIFLIEKDLHMEAYAGFYLLKKSSDLPYVEWQTSPSGIVKDMRNYFMFSFEDAISVEEMREKDEIRKLLSEDLMG